MGYLLVKDTGGARAQGSGPGARGPGPGPGAQARGPGPGARGPGPRSNATTFFSKPGCIPRQRSFPHRSHGSFYEAFAPVLLLPFLWPTRGSCLAQSRKSGECGSMPIPELTSSRATSSTRCVLRWDLLGFSFGRGRARAETCACCLRDDAGDLFSVKVIISAVRNVVRV